MFQECFRSFEDASAFYLNSEVYDIYAKLKTITLI